MFVVDRSERALALVVAAVWVCSLGCAADQTYDDRAYTGDADRDSAIEPDASASGGAGGAGGASGASAPDLSCVPAVASDALRARSSTMMARGVSAGPTSMFTADLFGLFASNCGGCHVDADRGGLRVSLASFPTALTTEALQRITSDDPDYFMPPRGSGGMKFTERAEGDPVVEFARLLEAWLAAGRPVDVFAPPTDGASEDGPSPYVLSEEVGTNMTNLGNCIPSKLMVGADIDDDEPDELDAMFALATELPERLDQTDIVSLDSEVLARRGVVAFAPAYTLWADNAKKVRMVRVPRGESIRFDKEAQRFVIPPNTRFYKTFMKHVVDLHGNESYRKMETRLILSRPDEPDGNNRHTALFGTYAWNDEETEAVLVRDPLRNTEPFRDRLITYVTDEQMAEEIITTGPLNLQEALDTKGVSRTYAIPGSQRCIQCHMGSPDRNFVLGFTPLQINRRPMGEGGVIEPAGRDELNQLQRLIDYGVITGLDSADEIVPLEEAQGDREPRNENELNAQGYMVGNCAHCHNPRGYPSVIAPELRDVLDFFPSAVGGIFQFPLEKFSPRIFRGESQNIPQPYITPSLYDRKNDVALPGETHNGSTSGRYLPKVVKSDAVLEPGQTPPTQYLLAPWRSLIYRNVDTPFSYDEDFSIFPHMPMNTPGYDCRARQLLGSWMVSIPARVKEETAPVDSQGLPLFFADALTIHPEPQPYVEVRPDEPDFMRELRLAATRLRQFQASPRYTDCPESVDIVDPAVVRGEAIVPKALTQVVSETESYELRVPERAHYAVTDLTEPVGDWYPRRSDWGNILVDLDVAALPPRVQARVHMVQGVRVTDPADATKTKPSLLQLLQERPMGLWQAKPGCDFSSVPTASSFVGAERPRWMDVAEVPDDAPIYSTSAGAQIFSMICANCHGPLADSTGRLAATIADMTGGQTRVANLRDGFFGPMEMPGMNRERIFGPVVTGDLTAEDWGARYLVFMGLGGTQRTIPLAALESIRNGVVLGEKRPDSSQLSVVDANMLSVPLALCRAVLPGRTANFVLHDGDVNYSDSVYWKSALIAENGDKELWSWLCALDNEQRPVRVVTAEIENTGLAPLTIRSLRHATDYPSTALVGTPRGQTQNGIQADNDAPWCLTRPATPELLALVEAEWASEGSAGTEPPYCPDAFVSSDANLFDEEDIDRWATRGAMNAGLSVFLYLDALAKGNVQRAIRYDRCEELSQ